MTEWTTTQRGWAIAGILSATKFRKITKMCESAKVTEDVFRDFVMSCDAGIFPWVHHISWRDFLPPNLVWTDEDSERLGSIDNGPLTRESTKAMRRWCQLLNERRTSLGTSSIYGTIPIGTSSTLTIVIYGPTQTTFRRPTHSPHKPLMVHSYPRRGLE